MWNYPFTLHVRLNAVAKLSVNSIIFSTPHLCPCWILYPWCKYRSVLHWLCVGHEIDSCVALNCIACSEDHLLAKCSLSSFFNDYSCLIKLCFIDYILFNTLIAFYLLLYVPCVQLVISLMKVLFVCECFRIQVYAYMYFTTSRIRCEWVLPLFPNLCLSLESVLGFSHGIAKMGDFKVFVYNYIVLVLI